LVLPPRRMLDVVVGGNSSAANRFGVATLRALRTVRGHDLSEKLADLFCGSSDPRGRGLSMGDHRRFSF